LRTFGFAASAAEAIATTVKVSPAQSTIVLMEWVS
jgi:hypothetical protein